MKKMAIGAWTSMVLLAGGAGPVLADSLRGDIHVMQPDGATFRIPSPSADAWWDDYYSQARCVSCRDPRRSARLLGRVEEALGTRFAAGPRYLVLPAALDLGWPHAWLFYPSTDRTPAYLVRRGGIGSPDGRERWDVWQVATERMERAILEGPTEPARRSAQVEVDNGDRLQPWVLIAATAAAAFGGWLVGSSTRPRFRSR